MPASKKRRKSKSRQHTHFIGPKTHKIKRKYGSKKPYIGSRGPFWKKNDPLRLGW